MMNVVQPQLVCENCAAELSPDESTCSACGHLVGGVAARPRHGFSVPSVRNLSRWQVLVILFLGTGPLGLPILWRNDNFTLLGKLIVSCALIACTVFLAGILWYLLVLVSQPIWELVEYFRSA
jgi:hypothetical protein